MKNAAYPDKKRLLFKILRLPTAALLAAVLMTGPVPASYDDGWNYPNGFSDKKTLTTKDPVSAGDGAFIYNRRLFSLGGPIPLTFTLTYDSARVEDHHDGQKQFGWFSCRFSSDTFHRIVEFEDRRVDPADVYISALLYEEKLIFKDDGAGNFLPVGPEKYQLQKLNNHYYLMDPVRERVYIFQSHEINRDWEEWYGRRAGELVYVIDRNGNTLSYTYNGDYLPTQVSDGLGRNLVLSYVDNPFNESDRNLASVSDGLGRSVTFTYDKVSGCPENYINFLQSFTDAMAQTTNFLYAVVDYDCDLITGINRPSGNAHIDQTWNAEQKVAAQDDAYANTTTFTWSEDVNGNQVATVLHPDTAQRVFTHKDQRYPVDLTDENGKQATTAYNSDDQLTAVTDRLGDSTGYTYHGQSGKIASLTNAEGDTVSYTYTAQVQTFTNPANSDTVNFTFYDLTQTDYPDTTSEQFTYDTRGNLLTHTDPAGKTRTYTYNSRGQVLTATNPSGGVTTYTYNADATPATSTDSDTGITTYGYDTYGRLNRITHPDTTFIEITYNLNDQVTAVTDENSNTHAFAYDTNGNLTTVTDPAGKTTQYDYDLMDRIVQVTDRLGKNTDFTYDTMGRPASLTDPNGLQAGFGYDARGWFNQATIGGQTWQTGHDDEGVVASRTTPMGHGTVFQTDKLGYATGITDPLSNTTTLSRDTMTRVTGVTDPLTNIRQYDYDTRGRLGQVTFPDTVTLTRTYDDAGRLTRRLYSSGPDLQFTYDACDRLKTADNISLNYDDEGRVTGTEDSGTSFGATYDDGGRLKTVTYNNAALTVTYTYEAVTGLLSRVTDNLTGTRIDFSYDNDRNLTGLARSNGVDAVFTRDIAARLTRIREGGIIDIQYTLDDANRVTGADMTVPLDPAACMASATNSFTYDAASQVSTSGYAYDSRGRRTADPGRTCTWDGASRLTEIDGAVLAYNGMNDLVTRTRDGSTIHYYYNYAVGLTPVAAEQDAGSSQFLRYYVWTPDGDLLYMIDAENGNTVYFYHFDRTGSTLALTNAAGAVTDAYAYAPYGELLRHNGSSVQPFTFAGRWGVRQEGDSGSLYHMRARYYDAAMGQFISREPIWPVIADAVSINPYQYAQQNPISNVDPTGLFFLVGFQLLDDFLQLSPYQEAAERGWPALLLKLQEQMGPAEAAKILNDKDNFQFFKAHLLLAQHERNQTRLSGIRESQKKLRKQPEFDPWKPVGRGMAEWWKQLVLQAAAKQIQNKMDANDKKSDELDRRRKTVSSTSGDVKDLEAALEELKNEKSELIDRFSKVLAEGSNGGRIPSLMELFTGVPDGPP